MKKIHKMKKLEGKFKGTRIGYINMLEEADKKGYLK